MKNGKLLELEKGYKKAFMLNHYVLVVLLFCSCTRSGREDRLLGNYVPTGYKNTFDTITLMKNGNYERKVYDKFNRLVLNLKGRWVLENGNSITFKSFFLNLDRDVVRFPELLKNTSMELSVEVNKRNGNFYFCTGYYENQNCYKKID